MTYTIGALIQEKKIPDFFRKMALERGYQIISRDANTTADYLEVLDHADIVATQFSRYTLLNEVMPKMNGRCKYIHGLGVGHECVDKDVATACGIYLMNNKGLTDDELSDHAMGLLLTLTRQIVRLNSTLKSGGTVMSADPDVLKDMYILRDKTLGIVGFGNAAKSLIPKAAGFGMRLVGYCEFTSKEQMAEYGVEKLTKPEFIAQSDFISLHTLLSADTQYLFGIEEFKKMKKHALIINTSRGRLIKEADLIYALQNGYIAGAGLDVTDPEPIDPNHPFMDMQNVILTGHMAGGSPENIIKMWSNIIFQADRINRGESPLNILNP